MQVRAARECALKIAQKTKIWIQIAMKTIVRLEIPKKGTKSLYKNCFTFLAFYKPNKL